MTHRWYIVRKKQKKEFDFIPLGKAIKNAREDEGMTREQVAEHLDIDPSYYAKIEDNGQYPSLNVLYTIIKMFQISVDEFFFPNIRPAKSTKRIYIEALLDKLSDHDLKIIEGTAKGILKAKDDLL